MGCYTQVQTDNDEREYQLAKVTDPSAFIQFLKEVEPLIMRTLSRNLQSTAFDGK